ncbi:(2Fe-2S)-binding protein [Brevibacterium casei]|uniref:(2Fe-2S)-binding protein n=2 Tax=Brevibacterium casei TaxID=33889 RepID=K9AY86_9MICO|nr:MULTISPECIES: (2Fe-2S)-binding protein [Brevibacterium]SII62125.1 Uncharacterized anaerobic dehydrogenase [Mycobacteroides abscessus subsp. abscessus]EKU47522.1 hypothetical protein C272_07252 [Brevibacterium casei S18]MCT1448491.1 (2Fe-2S)-binding protein [Brevibacterium casei]MCT1767256.1 (2Fe-2S)-binding protein [Brevibacterium casei]MCT2359958.1 (2Fe-2S)-binding protein [Brevibacterium casei]
MSDEVTASFDGSPLSAPAGASVAAALLASGRTSWRTTRAGRPRGLFCGIGVCFDCLVDIDGQTGQRACMIPLAEGMDIRSAGGHARRVRPTPRGGGRPSRADGPPPRADGPPPRGDDGTTADNRGRR